MAIVWGVAMAETSGKYLWLHGYRSQLAKKLTKKDGLIQVLNQSDLWDKLAAGYSFLTIADCAAVEVVRVERFGNDVKITRGAEGTQAQAFPAGSCVMWEVTQSGVQAACNGNANLEKAADCGCS